MMTKKAYVPPVAEQTGYTADIIMVSDNLTADKAWSEWTDITGGSAS